MKCDEMKTVCYIDAYSTMPVYCAKEVDSAIDELKREHHRERHEYIDMVAKQRAESFKRERHHKYKRCLANAEACMHKRWRTDEGFDFARSTRHMNKWLELSEKFKQTQTAQ